MNHAAKTTSAGRLRPALLAAACLTALAGSAHAAEAGATAAGASASAARDTPPTLAEMSLQELMDVEVTSVSRRPEKVGEAAAAVFVITADDIRRSGMTTLPDVLRLAPGVNVAQAHTGQWAVSIRGFNDVYSSKLLVLIDGRPIYSAAYAGVLWFVQDVPPEDIERIEVIRGPGAAVWGANAVNGVINIITKSADATQGTTVSLTGGDGASREQATVVFGGRISDTAAYRVFLRDVRDPALKTADGRDAGDPLRTWDAGFRLDWTPSAVDHVTAEGQYLAGRTRVTAGPFPASLRAFIPLPVQPDGRLILDERNQTWFVQAAWERSLANGSVSAQAYYERDRIGQFGGILRMGTLEGEGRYSFALGQHHQVVLGAGYRQRDFSTLDGLVISIVATAPAEPLRQVSLFGQDSISVAHDLTLTAGAKAEHSTETGWEFEPSLRLAWTATPNQTFWAAASRAVRSPSIADRGLRLLAPLSYEPMLIGLQTLGDPNAKSEVEVSLEAGYRAMLSSRLSIDLAVFDTHYRKLTTLTQGASVLVTSPPPPMIVIPAQVANLGKGQTRGLELSANWQVTQAWRLIGSYSALSIKAETPAANISPERYNDPGSSPRNQFQLRSQLDLPHDFALDAALFRIGRLATGSIPAHTRLDLRLGWRPTPRLEIAVVGQDLLKARHPEITPMALRDLEEIPRTAFVQLRTNF
ncbi:TonB-dependent receptor plug domain-containing protein [Phenylobacterium soli]|uniref:TonB-dependent receptor n=1 Tax=Phenylobacterium soli TaxID=2170551 RepID=A0A328AQA2_9CAUL|nr:TonB-dependent receptor [Phenylobacterium soli]RAK55936.1 hypothetical protein DJ017_16180 [Phenylobacterium soli]